MKISIHIRSILLVCLVFFFSLAEAVDEDSIHRTLSDALVCKGKPEHAVYDLVRSGSNFAAGYASAEFGEGTSEKSCSDPPQAITDRSCNGFGGHFRS
jgi:hypothetical protein